MTMTVTQYITLLLYVNGYGKDRWNTYISIICKMVKVGID